jgi:two-component system, sensor histidine kinase LadS
VTRALLVCCLIALSLGCSVASSARAQATLDVASDLRGAPLGTHVALFEDPSRRATIEEVSGLALAGRFRASQAPSIALGYSDSAYWLRLRVQNTGTRARSWLLELAYPHIDRVDVYVARADGGYDAHLAGDLLPFSARQIAYRNFVFVLDEPAHSARTYYLRVESNGSLRVPLVAWTMREFVEHQHLDWAGLCAFYGVLLVMTFYALSLYLFTRQRSYLVFAFCVLTMGLFQFTFVGHTFQFLLPHEPALAQYLLRFTLTLSMVGGTLLKRYYLRERELPTWYKRVFDYILVYNLCLTALSCFAPDTLSLRGILISVGVLSAVSFASALSLAIVGVEGAYVFFFGWAAFLLGGVLAFARVAGLIPDHPLSSWSEQIGMTIQAVLLSAGLAGRLNSMRAELGRLNGELSFKVTELEEALARAEDAGQQAETVTRVKDEFMATMSHELRTPLNTIINLPQGLLEDFPLRRFAICRSCQTHFELERGEVVDAESVCLECQAGGLLLQERAVYAGRPERTAHYLHKIERSGLHLLRVVHSILDEGKTEEGHFKLLRERFDLVVLVRDVLDEMAELAEREGVQLVLAASPEVHTVFADPLRLRQVLINLLANAIKFSDGAGTVSVSIGVRIASCVVAVRDSGIGIAEDKLDRLFENFGQVHPTGDRKYGGTGLGLSISRSLIRRHGGEVWVQSELGRGSIFFFSIPHGTGVSRAFEPVRASGAS